MNKHRKLVIALGASALAVPFGLFAQRPGKVWRVGFLDIGSGPEQFEAFMQGLLELGYIEGKNILIERRIAEGNRDRFGTLAADLVRQKPDVIFAPNTISVEAAKKSAGTIPIVFVVVADPVGAGFVASLARPGGSITGTSNIPQEYSAKRLQLLKEAAPKISRIAVFSPSTVQAGPLQTSAAGQGGLLQFAEVQCAAKILGIEIVSTKTVRRDDFELVSAQLRKWRADSIYVVASPATANDRTSMVKIATTLGLPAIYSTKLYAEAGGAHCLWAEHRRNVPPRSHLHRQDFQGREAR